jgi:transcription initiation factor TFIIIB Brf1 subunit/transcription initiation factor TFIIB
MGKCSECNGRTTVINEENVCEECGLVVEPENLALTKGGSLGSVIDGAGPQDWKNVKTISKRHKLLQETIANQTLDDAVNLDRRNLHSKAQHAKRHEEVIEYLERYASKLMPPHAIQNAVDIYKKAVECKFTRGRTFAVVAAASIYASCRINKIPKSLPDIVNATGVGRRELGRTYIALTRTLEIQVQPMLDPQSYVPYYCSELKVDSKVQAKAIEILDKAEKDEKFKCEMDMHNPTGYAAAASYIASILCDQERTQRDVWEYTGVKEITIRTRYKELVNYLDAEERLYLLQHR